MQLEGGLREVGLVGSSLTTRIRCCQVFNYCFICILGRPVLISIRFFNAKWSKSWIRHTMFLCSV